MATLEKRASLRQLRVMRIIAGAVRNTIHYHSDWPLNHQSLPRSIAKRATGTLTAQWPEVLALPLARGVPETPKRSQVTLAQSLRAAQLSLGAAAQEARRSGDSAREELLINALRAIARVLD